MAFSISSMLALNVAKYSSAATSSYKKAAVSRHNSVLKRASTGMSQQQIRSVYSINKITLLGHVGGDPVTHNFPDGTSVTNFSLAVSESYLSKKTGEKVERTDWFRIAVQSEKLQENVTKMVQKGSRVYVEGTLRPKRYTDATGTEKTALEVIVRGKGEVVVVGRPAGENEGYEGSSSSSHHESL